jgi:hypothetical protein
MKVFDLACEFDHRFEGWFGSSNDFEQQSQMNMIACPVCGSHAVQKKLSAPRLNLGAAEQINSKTPNTTASNQVTAKPTPEQLQALWQSMARAIAANTEDVGERFVEEARRMHYQEAPERGIRGVATHEQAEELADEGIDIVSFPMPAMAKSTLQ